MVAYIVKRLALAVVVILLDIAFLSVLSRLIPGDPVTAIFGQRASPALIKLVDQQMDVDKPLWSQVWNFVGRVVHGDLGVDFISNEQVTTLVWNALPYTLSLAFASLALAALAALPLGVYAAAHPGGWFDRVTGLVTVGMITVPPYVAGLLLTLVFSVHFHVFPAIGGGTFNDPGDYLLRLILPSVALALTWVGYLSRLLRASMLEVLGSNYVRTARAVGLPERTVFYKYALKNAVIPTIAVLGVGLGNLLGGAVFIEVIFARPGLGSLVYNAIQTRNYTVVRGGVLVIAVLFVLANLAADLAYRVLDPRIRADAAGQ
jgi:peptide/nickel transport system permease protein